jgi:P27 family predicted phage terminase small subunit
MAGGIPGCKPVPAALKLLRGNPGKRSINENELDIPLATSLEPPEWANFTDEGRACWDRVSIVLFRCKLLTDLDIEGVVRYCDMLAKWYRVKKFLDKNGFSHPIMEDVYEKSWTVSDTGKKTLIQKKVGEKLKYMLQWPEVNIYRSLEAALTRKEQEYGMTPVARTRIYSLLQNADELGGGAEETMSKKAMRFAR